MLQLSGFCEQILAAPRSESTTNKKGSSGRLRDVVVISLISLDSSTPEVWWLLLVRKCSQSFSCVLSFDSLRCFMSLRNYAAVHWVFVSFTLLSRLFIVEKGSPNKLVSLVKDFLKSFFFLWTIPDMFKTNYDSSHGCILSLWLDVYYSISRTVSKCDPRHFMEFRL